MLRPLSSIVVPPPKSAGPFHLRRFDREFHFKDLKSLLGAADYSKAGERNAGLSAKNEVEREAARITLSELTLEYLYDHPLTDSKGGVDSVMRVNYDIDLAQFQSIKSWTLGQLKDELLRSDSPRVKVIGRALTGVMAAAVAKLMDVHELIYVARKINNPSKARTTLGLPGTLSSRLQPNHPIDDLRGLTFLTYYGWSICAGDALVGVNPAIDTIDNISAMLIHLDRVRKKHNVPTQICVLAHIKTQMACLERGVPVEVMFQSLAGTEATNLTEFDFSVDVLDQAYEMGKAKGPLRDVGKQFMYFETGQGSEFTYGKHDGIDMTTTEALCYGLARRYDPFMVNNVTGFIGPETHLNNEEVVLANLQDHFMGKLLGLPMGMAPCYTLHSQITLEGQQMAAELVASAGANYYMDVCLNTDRMLAYFDTSGHDNQTLREIHGRRNTPEFTEWAVSRGLLELSKSGEIQRGKSWGNVRSFCESDAEFQELLRVTPSIPGLGHAGPRPENDVSRTLRLHQAVAREAIYRELDPSILEGVAPVRVLSTRATDKMNHLGNPHLGAALDDPSVGKLRLEGKDIQIIISDGLSADAVHANVPTLLPILLAGLNAHEVKYGETILVKYGRVKLAEQISEKTGAHLCILFIGERPGGDAEAAKSLSAYFVYSLSDPEIKKDAEKVSGNPNIRFEYTVISNIYSAGLPPVEAGSVIVEKALQVLRYRAAGNRLEAKLGERR